MTTNGRQSHPLRAALEALGGPLKDWTVMQHQRDPFRLDTDGNRVNAQWLADAATALRISFPIHIRGIHYVLVTAQHRKPDGTVYANTADNSAWLEMVLKAARFLGYVEFADIIDRRNDAPLIRIFEPSVAPSTGRLYTPSMFATCEISADELLPTLDTAGFHVDQPYRIAQIGEKSSLEPVLGGVADRYGTDLLLGAGEITDTMLDELARAAAADGRLLIILYYCDCDPAGFNMATVVAHKLRARQMVSYPNLKWRLYQVALTPAQVREHKLPESPLSETEKRAAAWVQRQGVEQTEIDAIATLRPDLLERIAAKAVTSFYDTSLARRVAAAERAWRADVAAMIDEAADPEALAEASRRLDALRAEAAQIEQRLDAQLVDILDSVAVDVGELPPIPDLPNPQVSDVIGLPIGAELVCDSSWDLREHITRLKARKSYEQ